MRWQRLVRFAGGYPFAFAAVAVAIVALLPARTHLEPSTIMLAVVPVIIIVARFAGLRASAVAAVAGFLALDVLFVPPYHRLTVASPAEWIALVVFLAVALVSGQQTARIREREDAAVRRQAELGLVNDLALRLTSEHSPSSTAALIVDSIVGLLAAERAALYVRPGAVDPVCLAGAGPLLAASAERAMVGWVGHNGKAIALDVAALPVDDRPVSVGPSLALEDVTADGVYLPLHAGQSVEGVLYVRWPGGAEAGPAETRLLVAIANLAAAALGRQRLDELAARAKAPG
ncbi:MAG: DUF4118 domain-containing protein [Actinobacteria bacterium]|nr:MAG: DUF4118 domain-containing protein [Actinomycetota bacterium]